MTECVLYESVVALLLIDVINDLEFEEGKALAKAALPAAGNLATAKRRGKKTWSSLPVRERQLWPVAIRFQTSGGALCKR